MAQEVSFKGMFNLFSKFGDTKSDGTEIALSQSDKWMKQANLFNPKSITTTDTAISFKKFKKPKITFNEYEKFLSELAASKKINVEEIKQKMLSCGVPGVSSVAAASSAASGVTDRLTDTSKYTGSHKERFNESGKGKGIEGRTNQSDNSGYVQGYKEKDTYDKTH